MVNSFEMAPLEGKPPLESVRRMPSRAKSSLTDDRVVMSRMGATQELKVRLNPISPSLTPQLTPL